MEKEKQKTSKKILIISAIAFCIMFIFGFYVANNLFKPSFDKKFNEMIESLNKTTPVLFDDIRMDSVTSPGNRQIKYNYTLIYLEKEETDPQSIKENIEPAIIYDVKTKPDLKLFRDNDVTFIYSYFDKNGVLVHTLTITPDVYKSN